MDVHEKIKVVHFYRKSNMCADALTKIDADSDEDLIFDETILEFNSYLVYSNVS